MLRAFTVPDARLQDGGRAALSEGEGDRRAIPPDNSIERHAEKYTQSYVLDVRMDASSTLGGRWRPLSTAPKKSQSNCVISIIAAGRRSYGHPHDDSR